MIARLLESFDSFRPLVWAIGGILLGSLIGLGAVALLRLFLRRNELARGATVGPRLRFPASVLGTLCVLLAGTAAAGLGPSATITVTRLLVALIVVASGWSAIRVLVVAEEIILAKFRVDVADNLKARKVHTQIRYIRRIASFMIAVLAIGGAALSFDEIRQLGATLLTTAGVAGIIIGFAAQKTLAMMLAGLQVAFTQPIRLDDAVVVEGEWGWIEEITLTYVVVKLWDLRRLVVPVNYFSENVFQNWTRTSSRIIGSVFLNVDFSFPVGELRLELERILATTDLWDGKVQVVQVTGAKEHALELRILVSADTSPRLWDLRCLVREALVAYVRDHYPDKLPGLRARLSNGIAEPPGSGDLYPDE